MSEGLFHEYLQQENNKRMKLFVDNPEWKKMFVSLFVVASDVANKEKCSMEELTILLPLMDGLKNMSWDLTKEEKTNEQKYEAMVARNMVIETTRAKTYTLQDILTTDMHKLSMMNPESTQMFMATMDRILYFKGWGKALKAQFSVPRLLPTGRHEIAITYKGF
jgi:hypothetical protein